MKFLSFVLSVLFVIQINDAHKLNIELLYESLCPDSVRFVKNQLAPTFDEIADYVNITFVPFGKAFSNQNGDFDCQHGPIECKGNRIQSCVLNQIPDQVKQVQYVHCFMQTYVTNPMEQGEKCATQAGAIWEVVKQCVESKAGMLLQLQAEQTTSHYKPQFIPTIVYDKKFDQNAQDSSIAGFRDYVCKRLQKDKQDVCAPMRLKPIRA
ncbi:GILT-like protein 1 [Atheta coriaria]|uniref:GILT-like protein 1 n=1 Tax=Dalotia coriaria TaxID=877792 RepID=UPI0031F42947